MHAWDQATRNAECCRPVLCLQDSSGDDDAWLHSDDEAVDDSQQMYGDSDEEMMQAEGEALYVSSGSESGDEASLLEAASLPPASGAGLTHSANLCDEQVPQVGLYPDPDKIPAWGSAGFRHAAWCVAQFQSRGSMVTVPQLDACYGISGSLFVVSGCCT